MSACTAHPVALLSLHSRAPALQLQRMQLQPGCRMQALQAHYVLCSAHLRAPPFPRLPCHAHLSRSTGRPGAILPAQSATLKAASIATEVGRQKWGQQHGDVACCE